MPNKPIFISIGRFCFVLFFDTSYIYACFLFRQKNKSTKDIAAVRLYIASETMQRVVKNK